MNQSSIFLIDDNPTNLDLLAGILREHGYAVRIAPNAKLGLNAVRARVPDLIMLDITMPDMDGYQVCRLLKSDEITRDIPVIFISALDEAIDKVRAFEVGGVDYVTKPFQAEEVLARLENQLRISRLQKELQRSNAQLEQQSKQLMDANLKLRELDEVKAKFTAMLVHDLKSPLTVVKATLELFETTDEVIQVLSEHHLAELIAVSQRSIEKILKLIQEVLEIFKSDTQEIKLNRLPIDPVPFLKESLEAVRLSGLSNQIDVIDRIDPILPVINADKEQLERVLSNLLSNALKFTPPGGQITLTANTTDGTGVEAGSKFLTITVTDTGEGIAPEALPYLFDPYQQAHEKKNRGGVGLGLAIVKRIVAAHGGNVSVRSKLGIGSSFTVTLPID